MRARPAVHLATIAALGTCLSIGLSHAPLADPQAITPPENRVPAVWLGPQVLDPAEAGIGKQVPDMPLHGVDGRDHSLHQTDGRRGTVVVVRDPECPVSRSYGPRIAQLARQYDHAGFGFLFIYPSETLNSDQRSNDRATLGVQGIFVDRGSFALAEALGVKSTGDVFILDADHRIRYRGAVDDQYGLGYTRDIATRHYLRNALDDIRNGRDVSTPATAAPGCYIDADPAKDRLIEPLPAGQMLS